MYEACAVTNLADMVNQYYINTYSGLSGTGSSRYVSLADSAYDCCVYTLTSPTLQSENAQAVFGFRPSDGACFSATNDNGQSQGANWFSAGVDSQVIVIGNSFYGEFVQGLRD
jgi:hypothetical protein